MAREAFSCWLVSGQVMPRIKSVNMMTPIPKLPNARAENSTSRLVMGVTNPFVQIQPMISNASNSPSLLAVLANQGCAATVDRSRTGRRPW